MWKFKKEPKFWPSLYYFKCHLLSPDDNFSLLQACHKFLMTRVQACHKFVMTRVQACHKFVMTRVQACSKLTKAAKSLWNELAESLPQACRANSLQIITKAENKHNTG
ncbi:hypothetical protein AVEN_251274-1 [Araneus ventricosus]|uniref:Uncharacterized protein n=1 Tax=Araneus ventricosus TaxID=182803 RepID=A0A4Y2PG56_ARAVE|nr:hypothetical protein AVEN_251274-1 [Araneus ventricosus]